MNPCPCNGTGWIETTTTDLAGDHGRPVERPAVRPCSQHNGDLYRRWHEVARETIPQVPEGTLPPPRLPFHEPKNEPPPVPASRLKQPDSDAPPLPPPPGQDEAPF